jgi:phosphatidylserine/phosphatidylglycerophosphate/cardiolipin synthase-like enzyme
MSAVLASGGGWVGGGIGSIETALDRLFGSARSSLVMTIYSVTGALDLLPEWIASVTDRGVETIAVVNRLRGQDRVSSDALRCLALARPAFQLYDFDGRHQFELHVKVVVADEESALIGSSNFSKSGLLTNYEMAVLIAGEPARQAADLVRRLTASPYASRVPKH